MTAGLIQLVAYGAQDVYLTGNPMITYFKVVYRRHTNFAMESIQQTFSGKVAWGSKVTALISRNGDLVHSMTLEIDLPNITTDAVNGNTVRWYNDIGHHIVQQSEVEIGGQLIDRHYSDWLEIWTQLTVPASKKLGYRRAIGQDILGANGGAGTNQQPVANNGAVATITGRKLYVPLQFWFCRNVGLALPLIALQYHEVKINITFSSAARLYVSGGNPGVPTVGELGAALWVDYIYLDTDERRRFAQVSHEYLIEQLQFNGDESYPGILNTPKSFNFNLSFNHPVKELVWVLKDGGEPSSYVDRNFTLSGSDNFCGHNTSGNNPVISAKLQLNGNDRFAVRDGTYFNWVQPFKHHTCIPDSPGINVYSFALKPEEHQPSGTCNFSRIDNAKLNLTLAVGLDGGVVKVFATNYNVLRIMSGMGGLAYSN